MFIVIALEDLIHVVRNTKLHRGKKRCFEIPKLRQGAAHLPVNEYEDGDPGAGRAQRKFQNLHGGSERVES